MMPIDILRATAASRMFDTTRRTQSCDECDMFSRAIFMPASIILPIISADSVAGPRVATIFVLRIAATLGEHPKKRNRFVGKFAKNEERQIGRASCRERV